MKPSSYLAAVVAVAVLSGPGDGIAAARPSVYTLAGTRAYLAALPHAISGLPHPLAPSAGPPSSSTR